MKEITNQIEWNALVQRSPARSGVFLQSWEWGEFQQVVGRKVYRFSNKSTPYTPHPTPYERAQVIEVSLPLGKKYWFVPRGNVFPELIEEAKKRGALFVRFEPAVTPKDAIKTTHVNPPATLIVDLTKSEDELLAGMHEKTRYNVRLAAKKGVKCVKGDRGGKGFEVFWKLLDETAKRDGFRTHPRAYYEKMLKILNPTTYNLQPTTCFAELWLAEHEGKTLAAGIWIYFGDTVTYLHGASSNEDRNLMAPYLLHREVMRDAKIRGFKAYDMWGIETQTTPYTLHPTPSSWAGITRFKMGFGGEVVEYPGTYDLPISSFGYSVYKIARRLRRGI